VRRSGVGHDVAVRPRAMQQRAAPGFRDVVMRERPRITRGQPAAGSDPSGGRGGASAKSDDD
jgi:hypothetical protein